MQKKNKEMKNRKKNRTPCLPWNPAQGYKSQSLPKFLDCRLTFSLQIANFLPVPLNPTQEKNKSRISLPQIRFTFITDSQPLRFAPSLSSLRTFLRKHSWPSAADSYSLPALLNSSQPQELSCFPALVQPHMADLSATVAIQNGVPTETKYRKYYKSVSTDIGHFDHGMVNGPQLTTPPFFLSQVIPDFPAGSSCPPQPIFTSRTEKAPWTQGFDKRNDSFLREVPET